MPDFNSTGQPQAPHPRRQALRYLTAFGAVSAAASLTVGCALLPWSASPPSVHLLSIERLQGEPLERRFELHLRIQNPNPKPIDFKGMVLTLDLNNRMVGTGVTDAVGSVPAHGDTLMKVAVTVSALPETLQMLGFNDRLPRGDLPYTLTGRFTGGTLERVLGTEARFEATGSVRWPR
jgi:LEA14-like dessication related protein